MFPSPPPAPPEAAATRGQTAQGKPGGVGKKAPLRPPPGVSGTVASLVISPDWFAAKEANQRERFWWSPGMYKPLEVSNLGPSVCYSTKG